MGSAFSPLLSEQEREKAGVKLLPYILFLQTILFAFFPQHYKHFDCRTALQNLFYAAYVAYFGNLYQNTVSSDNT